MPGWTWWVVGGAGWFLVAALAGLFIGAVVRIRDQHGYGKTPPGRRG